MYFLFETKSYKLLRYVTFFTCTLGASLVLEVIQHMINPSRVFDVYDIISNMTGSLLGLLMGVIYQNYIIKRKRKVRYSNIDNDISSTEPFVHIKMNDIDV